jgi:hypothetical protein
VKEPGMNLRVWYPSNTTGNRRKPSQVKLTYTETAGGTCSQSWLPALRTDSDTNSAGALVSRGQPFAGTTNVGSTTYTGSYKICAVYDPDGAGGNNPRYQELTSQTLTNFGAATTKNVVITDSSPFTATSAGNCP